MINIAFILKDAPEGLELYSIVHGKCYFEEVFNDVGKRNYIKLRTKDGKEFSVSPEGKLIQDGECIIYPSDSKTWDDWQKRLMPSCVGSVIMQDGHFYLNAGEHFYPCDPTEPFSIIRWHKFDYTGASFVNKEVAEDFFKILFSHGYKWDKENKKIVEVTINEYKSKAIAEDLAEPCDGTNRLFVLTSAYAAAMAIAEWKDEQFKKFLYDHISVPYEGEYGEDGSPIAKDYIEWCNERTKKANELFEQFSKKQTK